MTRDIENGRYLTSSRKREVLQEWRRSVAHATTGPGGPDRAIVPWCERLNRLPGVCTLQSCAGHRGGETLTAGHLWLWLSLEMATEFQGGALALAAQPTIERVYTLYGAWGQEVSVIEFAGEERGCLDASMTTILEHFRSLSCLAA